MTNIEMELKIDELEARLDYEKRRNEALTKKLETEKRLVLNQTVEIDRLTHLIDKMHLRIFQLTWDAEFADK